MYQWSSEQEKLFETALAGEPLILVNAIAGAAKSTSAIETAKRLVKNNKNHKIRYLVFGNANAAEAKEGFKHTAQVSTIHSLAYQYMVKGSNLRKDIAGWLTWKDIPQNIARKIPFGKTSDVLYAVESFCSSPYTTVEEWAESFPKRVPIPYVELAKQVLSAMYKGEMRITHGFYLKLFHIQLLRGKVKLEPIDTLIVDEVNDLTQIMFDVTKLYPAKQKILLGDHRQAIHGWMGCINAFKEYEGMGCNLNLTQSFRVSNKLAPYIEMLYRRYCDVKTVFRGMEYKEEKIKTTGYICRTNNAVINKMLEFKEDGVPFKLIHKAKVKQMFKLPLAIAYAKPGFRQMDPDLQHLQDVIDEWGSNSNLQANTTLIGYLRKEFVDDENISAAILTVIKYGRDKIIDLVKHADDMKHSEANITVMTAHVSKGLTMDKVILDPSMDIAIMKYTDWSYTDIQADDEVLQEFNLYMVALTRARYAIEGSILLDSLIKKE